MTLFWRYRILSRRHEAPKTYTHWCGERGNVETIEPKASGAGNSKLPPHSHLVDPLQLLLVQSELFQRAQLSLIVLCPSSQERTRDVRHRLGSDWGLGRVHWGMMRRMGRNDDEAWSGHLLARLNQDGHTPADGDFKSGKEMSRSFPSNPRRRNVKRSVWAFQDLVRASVSVNFLANR